MPCSDRPGRNAGGTCLADETASRVPASRVTLLSQFWFPLLVLAVSLTATVVLWRVVDRGIVERAEALFQGRAEEIASRIVKRLHDHEQVLLGANALFHVKGDAVTRGDWRRYVSALKLSEYHPGILGVGYSAWLPPVQKDAHIRTIRAEGFPEYFIRPAGERPAYTAIIWLEPFNWRNQRAFGYDMYTEPQRRDAMARARDTGETAIAARIILVQETDQDTQHGLLMYVPSYRQALPTDTVEQRRTALRGFVYSPIRMNDFVQGTLSHLPADLDFEIHVEGAPADEAPMFSSRLVEQRVLPEGYRPAFSSVKTVEAYGTAWRFTFQTLPAFDKELNQSKSLATLLTGILASFLLSALAALQAHSRRQALTIAAQMHSAKQAAEAARVAAEEASRAKSDFLATMSHEIRTPMTVFMSAIEQLLYLVRNSQHRQLLDLADRASKRLHNLVNEILDFSKIEARRIELDHSWFDLRDCLGQALGIMAAKAGEKALRLELEVAPEVPEHIAGDQYRLGQILINLIGNAIKFTDVGTVKVSVRRQGEVLEFAVSDTGIGIPTDQQGRIFETFSQVDSSSTRKYGGTGLGLAISKGLVELMGGRIGVRSQPGVGSTFSFTLPVQHLPTPEAAAAEAGQDIPAAAAPAARILLADDNPMVRAVIQMALAQQPWQALTADNGREAVRKWEEESVDLILMDLQMPEMDGLAATREIRRQEGRDGRRVGIIGLTAHADPVAHQRCLDAGMDEVLVKPFENAVLYAAIQRCLAAAAR